MEVKLNEFMEQTQALIQEEFEKYFLAMPKPEKLFSSMRYSLDAGGKRIRPMLLFASYQAYKNDFDKVMSSATALEMIHTYSLIHDDLPAMDDDMYRRGKLTNHKVFDEATAILAGDALLTYSFEIIANDPLLSATEKVKLISMLASASGPHGMVAGQIMDMEAEKHPVTLEELEMIHTLKTGKLIDFAITAGAYLGGASEQQLTHLRNVAYYLGLIFQVQDDILDCIGDEQKLGKAVGSDEVNLKSTYPAILGISGAIKQKELYVQKAKEALDKAGSNTSLLIGLIDYFSQRDH